MRYSLPTDRGFTGQIADATSGLDYYDARYYDPLAGQFVSADSMLPGAGLDPFGLSRYAYVEGNPIVRTDPTGRSQYCPSQRCGDKFSDPCARFFFLCGGCQLLTCNLVLNDRGRERQTVTAGLPASCSTGFGMMACFLHPANASGDESVTGVGWRPTLAIPGGGTRRAGANPFLSLIALAAALLLLARSNPWDDTRYPNSPPLNWDPRPDEFQPRWSGNPCGPRCKAAFRTLAILVAAILAVFGSEGGPSPSQGTSHSVTSPSPSPYPCRRSVPYKC